MQSTPGGGDRFRMFAWCVLFQNLLSGCHWKLRRIYQMLKSVYMFSVWFEYSGWTETQWFTFHVFFCGFVGTPFSLKLNMKLKRKAGDLVLYSWPLPNTSSPSLPEKGNCFSFLSEVRIQNGWQSARFHTGRNELQKDTSFVWSGHCSFVREEVVSDANISSLFFMSRLLLGFCQRPSAAYRWLCNGEPTDQMWLVFLPIRFRAMSVDRELLPSTFN